MFVLPTSTAQRGVGHSILMPEVYDTYFTVPCEQPQFLHSIFDLNRR